MDCEQNPYCRIWGNLTLFIGRQNKKTKKREEFEIRSYFPQ